jgi:hypothetical protein
MKFKWEKDALDYILMVELDGEWLDVGYLNTYGDWWEVTANWMPGNIAPDGARFLSLRAAKLYFRKHALIAIIGGYKP